MSVTTVRLRPGLRRKLEEEVERRGFNSLSDAINAAVENFVSEGKTVWKERKDVRAHFAGKKRLLRSLEEVHEEEDI